MRYICHYLSFSLNFSLQREGPNQFSNDQVRSLNYISFPSYFPNIYLRYYHNDSARLRLFTTISEGLRSRVPFRCVSHSVLGARDDPFTPVIPPSVSRCVASCRCHSRGERDKERKRTGGRTRARACRKREHGRPRVLPSRCTWVALISPGGSGGRGGGDGDGGGGGGAATNLRAFRHRAGVLRKGMHERGGRLPHPLAGVARCVAGRGGRRWRKQWRIYR